MSLRHISEPRRVMIRGVLAVIVAAWAIVFVRFGWTAAADLRETTKPTTPGPSVSGPRP